ncbi:latent-transforming growth factor beta-binding protein 2 [Tachyglossus aculeatus]|uniref:latent-transforming growth factor beta-binding protein 2 n=1 Tax=Tachyglossus aculeatus TaxID=9261 RepID=UPI0018F2F51A|nr:latent-transforming growth factor beta-binding protein 2 [Tachyglossus aculeatus]
MGVGLGLGLGLALALSGLVAPGGGQRVPRGQEPSLSRERTAALRPAPRMPGRLVGRNVCGGQCCSGWTTANSTNRCIKPVCQPPCENRGYCSRPQVCVCRSGFRGARCQEVIPEEEYHPPPGGRPRPPGRGTPTAAPTAARPTATRRLPPGVLSRMGRPITSQQLSWSPQAARRHPAAGPPSSKALPGDSDVRPGDGAAPQRSFSPWEANITEKIKKIKIVFTPTICKQTCRGGRCSNDCERGDTTTLYSQGGRGPDPRAGFRIFFCQIPCLNGGRCVGRDECRCPANATGKFCHLPAAGMPGSPGPPSRRPAVAVKQSTYTLPLSNQLASRTPSLVRVHVRHPPGATVQVHQVARVRGEAEPPEENSLEAGPRPWRPAGPRGPSDGVGAPPPRHHPLHGYCYLNEVDGQCSDPLPELTTQEDCCGSLGAFWGLSGCSPCHPEPAHRVIENTRLQCPTGYMKMNQTHCKDIDECLLGGFCEEATCVNTWGSYLCTCKPGSMLDPSRSHCVSAKAVSTEQDWCYRAVDEEEEEEDEEGACSLPLPHRITKQICCCSRVGRGWGAHCQRCPPPESADFKEICPAGPGYTYSSSDIRMALRKTGDEEEEEEEEREEKAEEAAEEMEEMEDETLPPEETTDAASVEDAPGDSVAVEDSGRAPAAPTEPPAAPAPTRSTAQVTLESREEEKEEEVVEVEEETISVPEVATPAPGPDRCAAAGPDVCGPGTCVNLPDRYGCVCGPGYRLQHSQERCTDDDECQRDPCEGKGQCINRVGSYSCLCYPGYRLNASSDTPTCQDRDECEQPGACKGGRCTNTAGSYRCECERGYVPARQGDCEDIDECRRPGACPTGRCVNSPGSFHCLGCAKGYRAVSGGCNDENECLSADVCLHGKCVNLEGSFRCVCDPGYREAEDGQSCQDVDECQSQDACPSGLCFNSEGSYSCLACPGGFEAPRASPVCTDVDECKDAQTSCQGGDCVNTLGSYLCRCPAGRRLTANGTVCEDVDECANGTPCGNHSFCDNTDGSFRCLCDRGYRNSPSGPECVDVNECEAMVAACGAALCENVEGSFLCLCASDLEEYDARRGRCRPREPLGPPEAVDGAAPGPGSERPACYSDPSCTRLLSGNATREECCCTRGAGWGHACQPCPPPASAQFAEICPSGKGYVPADGALVYGHATYIDADECVIFGLGLCQAGRCFNTAPGYTCLCHPGYRNNASHLECVDEDECANAACEGGACVNTAGSFHCFCGPPLVLDASQRRCVNATAEDYAEPAVHVDVCWRRVVDYACQPPAGEAAATYTECCCQGGEAWGRQCSLCPPTTSEVFAELCRGSGGAADLAPRPGYDYAPGPADLGYGGPPDGYRDPGHGAGPRFVPGRPAPAGPRGGFEGAEECGVLNGCQNGRCVRVPEGYTCDCFEGYRLDTARLACVDVNECGDGRLPSADPCAPGRCENTDGSFRCLCPPGLVPAAAPPRCA